MTFTLTLSWWVIALLCVIGGIVGALIREAVRDHGGYFDFDFISPILFLGGIVLAVGIVVGHFVR